MEGCVITRITSRVMAAVAICDTSSFRDGGAVRCVACVRVGARKAAAVPSKGVAAARRTRSVSRAVFVVIAFLGGSQALSLTQGVSRRFGRAA